MDASKFRVLPSPPDQLFRVHDLRGGDGTFRASMTLGPWLLGDDGSVAAGALGVLIDNVLAYAGLTRSPERWSVTTEMSLTAYPAVAEAGTVVHARAESVHADVFSGFATGDVRTTEGLLLASCSQRTRFMDSRPMATAAAAPQTGYEGLHLPSLVGGGGDKNDPSVWLHVGHNFQNPLANLHGGVSMHACDIAATKALRLDGSELTPMSIQLAYLRPVPAGTDIEFRPKVVHRGRTLAIVDVVGIAEGRNAIVARTCAQPA